MSPAAYPNEEPPALAFREVELVRAIVVVVDDVRADDRHDQNDYDVIHVLESEEELEVELVLLAEARHVEIQKSADRC
jgi:hypothetical protein